MKPTEENIDKFLKDLGIKDGKKYNKDGTLKTVSMEWVESKALIQTVLKTFKDDLDESLLIANLMQDSNIEKLRATQSNGEFRRLVLKLGKE